MQITGLLATLNWMLGSLALIAALFYPVYDKKFNIEPAQEKVVAQIQKITVAEQSFYAKAEEFLQFSASKSSKPLNEVFRKLGLSIPKEREFVYEAFPHGSGLLIRARTSPEFLRNKKLPLLVYQTEITVATVVNSGWVRFSGQKRGLGLF